MSGPRDMQCADDSWTVHVEVNGCVSVSFGGMFYNLSPDASLAFSAAITDAAIKAQAKQRGDG